MPTTAQPPPRIWTPAFVTIFVVNLVISFAQFMTTALIPKLTQSFGASSTVVGLATGIFAVTALSVRPAVGPATMMVRHRNLLVGTLLAIAAAMVVYAVSTNIGLVVAGRLLHGAGMGFLAPVTLAMASDTLPSERMAQGIGVFSLGQAAATAVGPSVGLLLEESVGFPATFLVGTVSLLVAVGLVLRMPNPALPPRVSQRFSWSSVVAREAVAPAVVIFFLAGAFASVNAFVILYGEARGVSHIGLFFTAYAVFILISRPLAGRLADSRGPAVVIVPGAIIFGLAFIVLSRATTLTGFLLAGAVSAFGYGICQPTVQALCLMSVEPSRRGVASNTNYIGVDLSFLVMPVIAGKLVAAWSPASGATAEAYSTMFTVMTIPVALGLAVYLLNEWRCRRAASGHEIVSRPTSVEPIAERKSA